MVALKTTLAVTGLLVASGAAQSWPQDFPACGVTCVTNLLTQTRELGCGNGDAKCFCSNANFHYGVRDCSNQACGSQSAAGVVQDYGRAYCSQAGQPTPILTTLNPAPTGAGNGNGNGNGTPSGTGITGPSVSIPNPVAVATSAIVSVVTNNGVPTTTTIGFTTFFSSVTGVVGGAIPTPTASIGTGGVSVGTVGASTLTTVVTNPDGSLSTVTTAVPTGTNTVVTSAVTTQPLATTITSGGSTFVSTTGSTTIGTTTTRPNYAAQATVAPGLLAAAGIVALLL